ncbi:MAG: superoxide dismutase family protein [Methanococcaceae archaeon]
MRQPFMLLVLLIILPLTVSFSQMNMPDQITQAIAVLQPTKGNNVHGVILFTKSSSGDETQVTGDITGLTPGRHGIHIHMFGDLSSEDGKSAGDHFNPMKKHHGAPGAQDHHAGDLGNIIADSSGKAHIDMKLSMIMLSGVNSIIGRSVVVHAGVDDLKSQPAGNSGPRIAVGVIGIAKK